jgi:hypothetical protein
MLASTFVDKLLWLEKIGMNPLLSATGIAERLIETSFAFIEDIGTKLFLLSKDLFIVTSLTKSDTSISSLGDSSISCILVRSEVKLELLYEEN